MGGPGTPKLTDYQDVRYAEQYLQRLQPILQADRPDKNYLLSVETARYLALWMTYEDAIRVADLKIRSTLATVLADAVGDYDLAVEVAECQRLVKGYGETHERGTASFKRIMAALDGLRNRPHAATRVRELREAALADEQGEALEATLKKVA